MRKTTNETHKTVAATVSTDHRQQNTTNKQKSTQWKIAYMPNKYSGACLGGQGRDDQNFDITLGEIHLRQFPMEKCVFIKRTGVDMTKHGLKFKCSLLEVILRRNDETNI